MRSIVVTTVLTVSILLSFAGSISAAEPTVACPLLTQAQIAAATGATVDAGSPIARPGTCQRAGQGKIVTLTITLARNGKSPVDQFNASKAQKLPGIMQEPVSGVGDDAFYVGYAGANRAGLGLVVKKGSSSFEIRVYGFDVDKAKVVAKQLAQDVATKF
jgi:hypothetical protein